MQTVAKGTGGIVYELVFDVVRFPAWWYTTGIVHTLKSLFGMWQGYARMLAVMVWVKNIFVPMYGQYSVQGRIISVFMRGVQIVFRSIALTIAGGLMTLVFAAYVALPLFAFAFAFYHATGGIFGIYGE